VKNDMRLARAHFDPPPPPLTSSGAPGQIQIWSSLAHNPKNPLKRGLPADTFVVHWY
jgi:hypothetical protein